jgi:glycosyltransferase involved in cell wall biosynthesis
MMTNTDQAVAKMTRMTSTLTLQAPENGRVGGLAPLVSVIIPTYNRPTYLREALASAVGQTLADIEVIVQDNASTEDPREFIAALGDPRVQLYRNETNIGLTRNWALALQRARGKYISVLCDDDRFRPQYLERLVAQLEADQDLVAAFCDYEVIDEHGQANPSATEYATRRWQRHKLRPGVYRPFSEIAVLYRAVPISSVYRRDAIDLDLPMEIGGNHDVYLAYLAARTGRGCYYTPERLMEYRHHSGTNTRLSVDSARAAVYCWGQFAADDRVAEARRYTMSMRGFALLRLSHLLYRAGEIRAACTELGRLAVQCLLHPTWPLWCVVYALRLSRRPWT